MNQIGLVGRLTKDPVLRQYAENRVQVHFTLAVNRNFRNYKGEIEADYVYCTTWGRLAEHIAKYCGKGSLIGVNGRIQTRSYMKEGNAKVYVTEVIVEDVRFYVLKSTDYAREQAVAPVVMSTHSGAQHVAESTTIHEQTAQLNPALSTEFVLPKEEPNLPVI